ncbi:MAG: class I SAM-dependent methyltransferase [Alphaproteobacteria bacterium]|nr:class I SAM-dependent methyltransferase [Alphaproteobacteria bacterium]
MTEATLGGDNARFWDELCGSTLARTLGISDHSPASLQRFDDWYFRFYPYLARHVPFPNVADKRVLEVGLGYGSVGERLARAGADYHGLDIAAGPVAMLNLRLARLGLRASAQQGSVLDCPFPDASFDHVVAIGCYHHTGDIGRALDETWRILKPGGEAWIMVYHAYSYRRWLRFPATTFAQWRWEYLGGAAPGKASAAERRAYDADSQGNAAPETAFLSRRQLKQLCARFRGFEARLENASLGHLDQLVPRALQLATLGRLAGLDVYLHLTK